MLLCFNKISQEKHVFQKNELEISLYTVARILAVVSTLIGKWEKVLKIRSFQIFLNIVSKDFLDILDMIDDITEKFGSQVMVPFIRSQNNLF